MLFDKPFLKLNNDESDIYHLKTECREDQHFVILSREAFSYLHEIYEGVSLKRVSIQLRTDDEEEEGDNEEEQKGVQLEN